MVKGTGAVSPTIDGKKVKIEEVMGDNWKIMCRKQLASVDTEIFIEWAKIFCLKIREKVSMENSIILFYDALRAHMCSKVIEIFLNRNIIVVVLAANTTHKLQPLGIVLFSCWKSCIRFYFRSIEQDIYNRMRSVEI